MIKSWFEKQPMIVVWINTFCGISGITLSGVVHLLDENEFLVLGIGILVILVVMFISYFIMKEQINRNNDKDRELDARNCEIEEKNKQIEEQERQIVELNNRVLACKKAIAKDSKKLLKPVDYYLIEKDIYDKFKTDLRISYCLLEVRLVKDNKDAKQYKHQFKWELMIKNDTPNPQKMVKFIFSGIKNYRIRPKVESERVEIVKPCTIREDIIVLRDDSFIEIDLKEQLEPGKDAVIKIEYELQYDFKHENDCIWLVPDALGFAGMDAFCIRFYCDGDIIHSGTEVELESYSLNEAEYHTVRVRESELKKIDSKTEYFEAKSYSSDVLRGYGYLLDLKNK